MEHFRNLPEAACIPATTPWLWRLRAKSLNSAPEGPGLSQEWMNNSQGVVAGAVMKAGTGWWWETSGDTRKVASLLA